MIYTILHALWAAVALVLFGFWIRSYAKDEAFKDYELITAGVDIQHSSSWRRRVAACLAACALFWGASAFRWLAPGVPVGALLMAYGLFGGTFREHLNLRRGKDWRYVSPSNRYDWFFIKRELRRIKEFAEQDIAMRSHSAWYKSDRDYTNAIHAAGTKAYKVEHAAFYIGLVTYVVGQLVWR